MPNPLFHIHKRKIIHQKHEPYPHPDKLKRTMDKLIYVAGITGPFLTIPQLYDIWALGRTSGVSLTTWGLFNVVSAVWLAYGVLHREKPIIIAYSLWIFFQTLIVIGLMVI